VELENFKMEIVKSKKRLQEEEEYLAQHTASANDLQR
jgi:hypothetical protein